MANKNKVEFGISQLHVGTYTVADDGTVTLGTPYHQKGAVSIKPEPDSESSDFYADNTKFWSEYADNGDTGSIVVAKFDDDFKTQFLGYKKTDKGGLARVKDAERPKVYIAFEAKGDAHARRMIVYNVTLGSITREHNTTEKSKTPDTESLDYTAAGDNATGIVNAVYSPTDTGYDELFTSPSAPAFETATE